MNKCIIVAIADNRAIGKDNALLWHIAEDMKYFRRTTIGSPVVMGYMTFLSIGGKPLPKRDNMLISIFPWPDPPEDISVVESLEEAY
ncbi:MAG: dihydrofolate reductase, partial [Bacteroidota bacterium]|nr:dihydrofolate reductase [Bacteroidota bacterium]